MLHSIPLHPAQHLLAADGRWGVMEEQRWSAFLDWLSGEVFTWHAASNSSLDHACPWPVLLRCACAAAGYHVIGTSQHLAGAGAPAAEGC